MQKALTPNQLKKLAENFYDDVDELEPIQEIDSDLSDAESEHSDHLTDSEVEGEDNDEEMDMDDDDLPAYVYGRNRFKWSKAPPAPSRTRRSNIVLHLPGIKGPALNAPPKTPLEAWSLLFTEDILEEILEHTNAKITDQSASYGDTASYVGHLDTVELKAFLGLLLLAGVFKSNHEDAASLFSTDGTGRNIFRGTMSKDRFLFLLAALRFDDQVTRRERIESGDKLAAISKIYNIFNSNCQANYTCGEYSVIDEMLVGFRGRCSFRQYLKSKPKKYGIKIMCLCDARTHYLLNSYVYAGKTTEPNPNKLSIPTLSVLKLVSPITNTNRNVTGDNWFSSIQLISELKRVGLTYVGTMRKNKREVPQQFLPNKTREEKSSLFGFTHDETIVSFVPKKNRCVLLVSSMHHSQLVEENGKPEIINFYNNTKGGVDALDQRCATYSCQRRTRRWPMAIFGAMLDISRVNSYLLFLSASEETIKMSRRKFSVVLGRDLIVDHMKRRSQIRELSLDLKTIIGNFLGDNPAPTREPDEAGPIRKYRRCYKCPREMDRKTKTCCNTCSRNICKNHSKTIVQCESCSQR